MNSKEWLDARIGDILHDSWEVDPGGIKSFGFLGWLGADVHVVVRLFHRDEFAEQIEQYFIERLHVPGRMRAELREAIHALLDKTDSPDGWWWRRGLELLWMETDFKMHIEEALDNAFLEFLSPIIEQLKLNVVVEHRSGVLSASGRRKEIRRVVKKLKKGIVVRSVVFPQGRKQRWDDAALRKGLSEVVGSVARVAWEPLRAALNSAHPDMEPFSTRDALRKRAGRAGLKLSDVLALQSKRTKRQRDFVR